MVEGTPVLRIDFDEPDSSRDEKLVPVSWDEFFRVFNEGLAMRNVGASFALVMRRAMSPPVPTMRAALENVGLEFNK